MGFLKTCMNLGLSFVKVFRVIPSVFMSDANFPIDIAFQKSVKFSDRCEIFLVDEGLGVAHYYTPQVIYVTG